MNIYGHTKHSPFPVHQPTSEVPPWHSLTKELKERVRDLTLWNYLPLPPGERILAISVEKDASSEAYMNSPVFIVV